MSSIGILAGLSTAVLWTLTAVCFESSSRWLGSFSVNVLRLLLACAMFVTLSLVRSGSALPSGLTPAMWWDLALSGLIGFVLGDVLLFEAFVLIGARLSMLIYASVPSMTALAAFLFLGETLSLRAGFGMLVTTLGIATAILGGSKPSVEAAAVEDDSSKNPSAQTDAKDSARPHATPDSLPARPVHSNPRARGVAFAIGGSVGQTAGLLLSKRGSIGIDAFAATEVRVLAGLAGFLLLALASRKLTGILELLKRAFSPLSHPSSRSPGQPDPRRLRRALSVMLCGAVLGPFLGVSLGLKSVQLLPAGVASTLMSIVPALLVPVSAVVFRERVRALELVGTAGTLVGVALLSV